MSIDRRLEKLEKRTDAPAGWKSAVVIFDPEKTTTEAVAAQMSSYSAIIYIPHNNRDNVLDGATWQVVA